MPAHALAAPPCDDVQGSLGTSVFCEVCLRIKLAAAADATAQTAAAAALGQAYF